MVIEKTAGFFAREVLKRFSYLPVEDELRLNNARIREHFLTGIYTLAAFRSVEEKGEREDLVAFHAANKLLLLAASQTVMREMGQLVASRAKKEPAELFFHYRHLLCAALTQVPRYTSNINVLEHALGYFQQSGFKEKKKPIASD